MNSRELLEQHLQSLVQLSAEVQSAELQPIIYSLRQQRAEQMAEVYKDLMQIPRYRAAVEFLLNDLYASPTLIERLLELKRAKSAMSRVLPEAMMMTVAKALEFALLSLNADLKLARYLKEQSNTGHMVSLEQYEMAVKAAASQEEMKQQLDLVLEVGREIESVVHKPFVSTALRMCRRPAKLMGLSELQDFLERGCHAFKTMRGSSDFFEMFYQRENEHIAKFFAD